MIEWPWLIAVGLFAWAFGFWQGGRNSDWYWADHGEHGGSVHHKGKFYYVKPEGSHQ
jgi:hypothetical protein